MMKADTNSAHIEMSLEEARAVRWLSKDPRPLGELLDEGSLDVSQLRWAAAKAYNSKLRAAAKVLLKSMESQRVPSTPRPRKREVVSHQAATQVQAPASRAAKPAAPEPAKKARPQLQAINAGLTIEQARQTLWAFKPYKGRPMGELVDGHLLSLKDLAYAVEQAWDDRVRRSAIVLLSLALNQAVQEPSAYGVLKVVSCGRSYAERQEKLVLFKVAVVLGVAFGASVTVAVTNLISIIKNGPPPWDILLSPLGIIMSVIALALLVVVLRGAQLLIDKFVAQSERRISLYRQGQEGESLAVEIVRQSLDGRWVLFRNVVLPDQGGDIDAVLVGPGGVWVMEIKAYTGKYRNIGEHWEKLAGQRWHLMRKNPGRQAKRNASHLSSFLKADGINQWVTPVVVWANPRSKLSWENPAVKIWPIARLQKELAELDQGRTLDAEIQRAIKQKLTQLCRRRSQLLARN